MAACPTFFKKTPGGPLSPFDERGFEFSEGWYHLVLSMALQLQISLKLGQVNDHRCTQIKQKWGRLEVYYEGSPYPMASVEEAIEKAQEEASRTCEVCRAPGRQVDTNGYHWVACPDHSNARLYGKSLDLLPHHWETEEVDGGPAGVSDFYLCRQCGASGGPAGFGGEVPRFPPFLAGQPEDSISLDCNIAKRQIERLRHV